MICCGLRLEVSRQYLSKKELHQLYSGDVVKCILIEHHNMMSGAVVNHSESRQALHTSLRSFSSYSPMYKEVSTERERILHFASQVRSGEWCGSRGDQITDVINLSLIHI